MWIITANGFVSLVEHTTKPDHIRARARRIEHLQDTFDLQDGDIIDLGPDCPDYRFHADIPRDYVAHKLYEAVQDLTYTSHVKESVARDDDVFYGAMLGCWRELHRLQDPPGSPDQDWWNTYYDDDNDNVLAIIPDLSDRGDETDGGTS